MKCMLLLFIVFALALTADPQINAIYDLIARVTSLEVSKKFNLEIIAPEKDGKDIFQIDATTVEDQVSLKGTDGSMLAYAFGQYLRYYCNSTRSWGEKDDGDHVDIPSPLPVVKETIRTKMLDEYRYYMNVCTFGYSYVWWDWTRWEKEIDWMAMNGINIPLAFVGQEYVFGEVYKDMGLKEEEIVEHFTGIGFLPWNRMGNLRGWGGPLTEEVRYNEFLLNKKIVERELALGMKPILPAFSGYVPHAILKYYPNVTHSISPLWAGFNSTYSNIVLIEPSDPLFKEISIRFIRKQIELYGTVSHLYNGDLFMEMLPKSWEPEYLASCSHGLVEALKEGDPDAIWFMEGWTFRWESSWSPDLVSFIECIKAFLDGVNKEDMVVFDMNSEYLPQYKKIGACGKRFIYGILPNYGSQNGLYGNVWQSVKGPQEARNEFPELMVGIGTFMEGIDENYIVYEAFYEMGWRKEVELNNWVKDYANRRYGQNDQFELVWNLLINSVYSPAQGGGSSAMAYEPRLNQGDRADYIDIVGQAVRLYLEGVNQVEKPTNPLRRDFVDVTREMMVNIFAELNALLRNSLDRCKIIGTKYLYANNTDVPGNDIKRVGDCGEGHPNPCDPDTLMKLCDETPSCVGFNMNGYLKNNMDNRITYQGGAIYYKEVLFNNQKCKETSKAMFDEMTSVIKDTDRILGTSRSFLLGIWIRDARRKAKETGGDEKNFVFNAKNQITLWGPHGEINDYSTRQWNGIVGEYQYHRWYEFLDMVNTAVQNNKNPVMGDYHERMMKWGIAWDYDDSAKYPEDVEEDCFVVGKELVTKYYEMALPSFTYRRGMTGNDDEVYFQSMSRDPGFLAYFCAKDPWCAGFNLNGQLFHTLSLHYDREKSVYMK